MKAIELEPHRGRLLRLAQKITRSPDLAQDAVQEAFFSVLNRPRAFQGASSPFTYLHRIVANKSIDLLRKVATNRFQSVEGEFFVMRIDPSFYGRTPEELALLSERLVELALALDGLSEAQKKVFRMVMMEGLTAREAGVVLGASPLAVRLHLHRAKKKLRKELSQ